MTAAPVPAVAWALRLEYDGRSFAGWQRQHGVPTLQETLEQAAAHLNGGQPVSSIAAGRTDAGVHATAQAALLHLPARYTADQVRNGLNFHLRPHPFVVLQAAPASPGWNPRFAATVRHYDYVILNRPARPALHAGQAWHVDRPLDLAAMAEGAAHLVGCHDFTSFRATACQAKSPVRTLDHLGVTRRGDRILIRAEARSFLHHQIRNIVGTLKLVGEGRWRPAQVAVALAARERAAAGPTAPPDGLTLTGVLYDPDPFTPPRSASRAAP